jgi:nucleotide-binding universal stress UspA family protein
MERILTAVDGSAPSLKAVAFAADLAKGCGAELVLLSVSRRISAQLTAELETYARQEHLDLSLAELGQAQADSVLDAAGLEARAHGATRIATRATSGDPAEEILAAARELRPDVIALGSRGHGPLVGLLLGSVAQKVLAHADCPVLVVR